MTEIPGNNMASMDPSDMLSKIQSFPGQLHQGWDIGKDTIRSLDLSRYRSIVFSGMGGSAVAGDLIQAFLFEKWTIPFFINRDYRLPGFLNTKTLFVASSYSGDTEETLSSLRQAQEAGCDVVCLASGGNLSEEAEKKDYPLFKIPAGYPPRAALGFVLGVLFCLFRDMSDSLLTRDIFMEAAAFVKERGSLWGMMDHKGNMPFQTANKIHGLLPLIYASQQLGGVVAMRWKSQINENSKSHAFWNVLPELNHNEIMGWQQRSEFQECLRNLMVVFLKMSDTHPRVQKRMEITRQIIEDMGVPAIQIEDAGPSRLARLLYLLWFGDFVSYYLAMLYRVDPTEISNIDHLKNVMMS